MFGNENLFVSTESAAFTVVMVDLLIIMVFWISLICLKPMLDAADKQV